jgi:hypothetical protein
LTARSRAGGVAAASALGRPSAGGAPGTVRLRLVVLHEAASCRNPPPARTPPAASEPEPVAGSGNDEAPPQGRRFVKSLGGDLLSHPASRAVPSALEGLTSGFGMGPGVSPPLWPPKRSGASGTPETSRTTQRARATEVSCQVLGLLVPVSSTHCCASTSGLSTRSSSRGPYQVDPVGDLILERASRLYAFSAYPFRTWPMSSAVGTTTHTPEVRPSRSSRTRDSSPQISYAHGG